MELPEPFERARRIRNGELDDDPSRPSYGELTAWIARVPATQIPGLIRRVVHQAVVRGVYRDRDALIASVNHYADVASDPNSFLRGAR